MAVINRVLYVGVFNFHTYIIRFDNLNHYYKSVKNNLIIMQEINCIVSANIKQSNEFRIRVVPSLD